MKSEIFLRNFSEWQAGKTIEGKICNRIYKEEIRICRKTGTC